MTTLGIEQQPSVTNGQLAMEYSDEPKVQHLTAGCEPDALNFLARRPAHTAYMAGLIHMNGLESPRNRGSFYAYRNRSNKIGGIALVGHAVTFEVANVLAAEALARVASNNANTVLVRGESDKIKKFWVPFANVGLAASNTCREQLLELNVPFPSHDSHYDLRPATTAELDQAVSMNVELALAERGCDPLKLDPGGFQQRLLRRIQCGQVWVRILDGKVIFKAEIITRTPEVVYLEGIYVHKDERRKGNGINSMRQLGNTLLRNARSLCVFVNDENFAAQALYRRAGYQTVGHYETMYLQEKSSVRLLQNGVL